MFSRARARAQGFSPLSGSVTEHGPKSPRLQEEAVAGANRDRRVGNTWHVQTDVSQNAVTPTWAGGGSRTVTSTVATSWVLGNRGRGTTAACVPRDSPGVRTQRTVLSVTGPPKSLHTGQRFEALGSRHGQVPGRWCAWAGRLVHIRSPPHSPRSNTLWGVSTPHAGIVVPESHPAQAGPPLSGFAWLCLAWVSWVWLLGLVPGCGYNAAGFGCAALLNCGSQGGLREARGAWQQLRPWVFLGRPCQRRCAS